MMYYSPITINRKRSTVQVRRLAELENGFTLDELKKIVKPNESIYIDSDGNTLTLTIFSKRPETDAEMKARIEKEESYMRRYTEYHTNEKKKS